MKDSTPLWIWAGVARPIRSRSEARKVRDSSARALTLIRQAMVRHGPIRGYVRSEAEIRRVYRGALEYLNDTRVCGAGGCL